MDIDLLPTKFARADRAGSLTLAADVERFRSNALMSELLSASPGIYLILNEQRQIVYASNTVLSLPGVNTVDDVIGLRPGEALKCERATLEPGGCGTSEFCRECGAVRAILTSLTGRQEIQECRLTLVNGEAFDLRVMARPLYLDQQIFSIFTVVDIADEKRRRVLERLFFHDILNTAGGMAGIAELLRYGTAEDLAEYKDMIYSLSNSLVDEIKAQQTLVAAEVGELTVEPIRVNSLHLLYEMLAMYQRHEVAQKRTILLHPNAESVTFISDKTLLRRVIGNMIKNALEATTAGQIVTVSCRNLGDTVEFTVHNPNEMPRSVQLQIFQRSFSTKGSGRGLGTYSMKLLTERYLHGATSFSSTKEGGTIFSARYPIDLPTEGSCGAI